MEAVMVDQYSSSISGYKQVRTPKKNTRVSGFKPSENIAPANMYGSGIFHLPPPHSLSFSYPPSLTSSLLHHNPYYQRQQNPPLLPLPVPMSSSPITRGLSLPPPTTRKTNKSARDHSITPKKPKSRPVNNNKNSKLMKSESLVAASTNRLGPDPNDLPKALATSKSVCSLLVEDLDKFSGSVFSLAPPPSSLPLPRFSTRPKLMSCNVEAAGIDAGATDDLRRLLRLR